MEKELCKDYVNCVLVENNLYQVSAWGGIWNQKQVTTYHPKYSPRQKEVSMTLKELTDSVNELKEIYPFEDNKTEISIGHNLTTNIDNTVSLKTVHGNGISI